MKNKQLALAELAKDCNVRETYLDALGMNTCAVGKLAQLAGVEESVLTNCGTNSIAACPELYVPIKDKFGLSMGDLHQIQFINDREIDVDDRRRLVCAYVSSIAEEASIV
jgi:hypothetical protein